MVENAAPRFGKLLIGPGVRLHYAEQGRTGGKPVVLIHGWPDSWFSFSRVLPHLPEDHRALALDLRGFGDSDRPETGYSIPGMASDVVAFLDALEIPRATVVGHSFGSFVARQLAIAQPGRVEGLVLIGTGFATSNPVTRDLLDLLRDLPDPVPLDFARNFQAGTIHHPVPPEFFEQLVQESLKLPPRLWRLAIEQLLDHDDTQLLERIQAPTLLLSGDRDALFPRSEQDRFLAALPSARRVTFEETGHCPNWERPEQVAGEIAGLMARG